MSAQHGPGAGLYDQKLADEKVQPNWDGQYDRGRADSIVTLNGLLAQGESSLLTNMQILLQLADSHVCFLQ